MPAAERGAASDRRLLHHDEAGTLKVLDKSLRDYRRHELVRVVDALTALKAQREGQRIGDVFWRGGERVSRWSGIEAK